MKRIEIKDPVRATAFCDAVDAFIKSSWKVASREFMPAPADGICPCCGSTEFMLTEVGYYRTTTINQENGDWFAYTSGFDDYSENGLAEFLVCIGCDAALSVPQEINWS